MTVTIYSIGDINYLELILNALAALFHSDAAPLGQLFRIGFLVGLILAIFRGLIRGRIGFQDFVVSFVVFWLMFVPRVNVTIEDMYTGSVKTVANVPIGPAFIGGAISQIGYRVTELFETAFSLPNMVPLTAGGFTDPLTVLIKVRRLFMQHLGEANSPVEGADVRKSFVNYIKDCTLTGVALHQKTMDDVERDPDVMNGIAYEHNAFGTQLFLGGPPTEPTCREATFQLQSFVSATWLPALRNKLATDLAVDPAQVDALIQQSLDALTGGTVQAQDFMLTAAIVPFLEEGIPAYHLDQMQFAAAQMVQQAILQRNTQWAAQYSLFERYVRPILTFIEGFTYAIGPFVAFALTLGPIAFRVASLYLVLNFWIQLWMPILAIINLYIQMAAGKQMAALTAAQYQYPSIAGLMQSDWILQDWLGVGGLLASSAPALAFMLLSGSAVAFTHMVSRLEGADAIDEKIVAPDVAKVSPVLGVSQRVVSDPVHGTFGYGSEKTLPSFDLGNLYGAMETYSRQQAQEATRAFSQSLSQSLSRGFSTQVSAQEARDLSRSINASQSHVDSYIRSQTTDIMNKLGLGEDYRDAVTLALGVGLKEALRGGVGLLGKGAEKLKMERVSQFLHQAADKLNILPASANLQDSYEEQSSKLDQIAETVASKLNHSDQITSELANRVALDDKEGIRNAASIDWATESSENLSRQAQDVLRTSETWNQTKQLGERFGASGSYHSLVVANRILSDEGLRRDLHFYLSDLGLKRDAANLAQQFRGIGKEQAYAIAGLELLTGYARTSREMSESERRQAMALGYGLIGRAMGGLTPGEMETPQPSVSFPGFGDTQRRVEERGPSPEGLGRTHESVQGEVQSRIQKIEGSVKTGEGRVEEAHAGFKGSVLQEGKGLRQEHESSPLYEEFEKRKQKFEDEGTPAKHTYEFGEKVVEGVASFGEKVVEGAADFGEKVAKGAADAADSVGDTVRNTVEDFKRELEPFGDTFQGDDKNQN